MILNYQVTGHPPFILGEQVYEAGSIVPLPVQIANHPLAMGALRPAPHDAEPAPKSEPAVSAKTDSAEQKASEGEAPKAEASEKEPEAKKSGRARKKS